MSNKRFALFVTLMLLVLSGCIVFSHMMNTEKSNAKREGLFPNASIYSPKPSGYKAWYTVFQKVNIKIRPWRKGFRKLEELPTPATMIIIEPHSVSTDTFTFSQQTIDQLLGWVDAGNSLIILDTFNRPSTQPFLESLKLPTTEKVESSSSSNTSTTLQIVSQNPLLKSYITEPLRTNSLYRFPRNTLQKALANKKKYHPRILLEDASQHPYLIQIQYGRGEIVLGTPSDMANNGFLYDTDTDNYQFFANLLFTRTDPLYVNEFVHGFTDSPDIFTYYSRTPLGHIAVQLAFLFAFLLWASFYRWKPALPASDTQLEQSSEKRFIDSLASIYERGQATPVILAPMVKEIETTLRNRFRVDLPDLGQNRSESHRVEEVLRTILGDNKRGIPPERSLADPALTALKKAMETVRVEKRLSHRDTLMLMQQLSLIQEKLKYGSRTN